MRIINGFLFIVLWLTATITIAQNAYYDAIYLKSHSKIDGFGDINIKTDTENIRNHEEVFRRYGLEGEFANDEALYNAIKKMVEDSGNPFFAMQDYGQDNFADDGLSAQTTTETKSISSAISGFNVATIADGLAKFLVNRAKQELSMAFFEQFKRELNDLEELRIIFPKTHALLNTIGEEIYNFSGYLSMLREAFQLDLQNMIPNLQNLLDDESLKDYLKTNKTVDFILRNALLIAKGLQNGSHPGDILTSVKDENLDNTTIKNLSPSLELLDLFSQSVRSRQKDRYWISSDSLRLLFKDEVTLKIYLGLMFHKGGHIKFRKKNGTDSISFGQVLTGINTNFKQKVVPVKAYLTELIDRAETIDQNLKKIRKMESEEEAGSGYTEHYAFYMSAVQLIDHVPSILKIPMLANNTHFDQAKFDKFIDIASDIGGLYLDINEKNYFGSVMGLSNVLDKTIPQYREDLKKATAKLNSWSQDLEKLKDSELASKLGDIIRYAASQDQNAKIDELMIALEKLKTDISDAASKKLARDKLDELRKDSEAVLNNIDNKLMDKYGDLIAKLMKYGNLAASIAKAENSDEVEKIIESIALPAGSSRIKRESLRNLALNAYVGMIAGGQDLPGEGNTGGYKPYAALSAPVGLAYSWGGKNSDKGKGGNSLTLFVPLIDVGALATFRFNDDSTAVASNIELKNIFAPGLFAYWGFKRVPLSFGFGGQLGPRLHDIDAGVTSTYDDYYIRWGATLAVDIPLLNFYTKPR